MVGSDEETIGEIAEIYEDPSTGEAEWATVNTGLLGIKSAFVPLASARLHEDRILTEVTAAQVTEAPAVANDDELTEAEEAALREHYGLSPADETSREGRRPERRTGPK